jgi:hypothetical protein
MKKFIIPFLLFCIFLLASIWHFTNPGLNKMPEKMEVAMEDEIEKEGGRNRAEWEWKMLRDPKTGKIPAGIRNREMAWVKKMPLRENGPFNNPLLNNQYIAVGPSQQGGRTRTFAFDMRYNGSSNRVVLSGGINGGIFRSTDGGGTWNFVHPDDEVRSVSCLAQDPRPGFQDTWYAGTGEPIGVSASIPAGFVLGNGILKSTDNGQTWSKLAVTGDNNPTSFTEFDIVNKMAVHPVTGDIYAAIQRRIVRSSDGGNSWSAVLISSTAATSVGGVADLLINKTGTKLFAAITGRNPDRGLAGVWMSDTGNPGSWTRIAGGESGQADSIPGWRAYNNISAGGEFVGGWGRVTLALAPSDQSLLYVLYENADNAESSKPEADLFRCTMSGTPFTWTNLSANLVAKRNGTVDTYFQAQTGYNLTVAVHPTQPEIVFAGGVNLFRSNDGFVTAANTLFVGGLSSSTYDDPEDISHVDYHFIAFDPSNANRMVTTSDGGLVSTENASLTRIRWSNLNNLFQTVQYYHVGIDPTPGSRIYFGGAQDNSTTFRDAGGILGSVLPDSNDHYILIGGDGCQVGMTKKNTSGQQYLFAAAQEGQFYRVKLFPPFNNTIFTGIKPATAGKGEFITYFHLDEDNTDFLYYVSEDTLYRTGSAITVSPGTGWTRMEGVDASINGNIFSLATTRGPYTANNHLFIGTDNGKVYLLKDPQASSPLSAPIDITPTGMSPGSVVSDIAVNPRSQDTIMVTASNYNVNSIFWTGNATALSPTWQVAEGNLTLPSVRSCAIVALATGVEYYVGTTSGLFSTNNINSTNTTWSRETGGPLTTAIVNSLAVRWQDNTMVAGTHGNGMFAAYLGNNSNTPPSGSDDNFIIAVYPTISSDIINYQVGDLTTVTSMRVQVINFSGQLMYDRETGYQNGSVYVGLLAKGTYALVITSNDGNYREVRKFFKN